MNGNGRPSFPPWPYPRPDTRLRKVIECLEAEPATLVEIASYLNTNHERAKNLVHELIRRKIVVKSGKSDEISRVVYSLTNPVEVASTYHE